MILPNVSLRLGQGLASLGDSNRPRGGELRSGGYEARSAGKSNYAALFLATVVSIPGICRRGILGKEAHPLDILTSSMCCFLLPSLAGSVHCLMGSGFQADANSLRGFSRLLAKQRKLLSPQQK